MPNCSHCDRTEDLVDVRRAECCGKWICFDYCLFDSFDGDTAKCPACGKWVVIPKRDYGDEIWFTKHEVSQ